MKAPDSISNKPEKQPKQSIMSRKEDIKTILQYCYQRYGENHFFDVAGNISFTVILSLVPMLAIVLAVLTTFPEFGTLQNTLETYFSQGMIPQGTAHTILKYLSEFAANATNVSIIGGLSLFITSMMTVGLIESTFNDIWHVMTPRTVLKRFFLFIVLSIFGPLMLGISIYLTSHLIIVSHGLIGWTPFLHSLLSTLVTIIWTSIAFTLLYRILPHRLVPWKDALIGGLFSAIAFEIAKRLFVFFIVNFSSYELIYGALAAIPIFLLWLYITVYIMLIGALVAALLPEIRNGRWHTLPAIGNRFSDAMKIIDILYNAETHNNASISRTDLEMDTHLSVGEVEYCLQLMEKYHWVATLKHSMISTVSIHQPKPQEWKWIGNASQITLADVYRLFVFTGNQQDGLTRQIDQIIDIGLGQTLTTYFSQANIKTATDEKI